MGPAANYGREEVERSLEEWATPRGRALSTKPDTAQPRLGSTALPTTDDVEHYAT
jgi:hypothetical protein